MGQSVSGIKWQPDMKNFGDHFARADIGLMVVGHASSVHLPLITHNFIQVH